jgi:hypothetical protein
MQFKSLFALIAASSLSTRCLSAIAAPARGGVFKINALDSQNHVAHADGGPPMHATQNGRLEAHWSFLVHDGDEVDYLYVDFYNGNSASPSMPLPFRASAHLQRTLEKLLQLTRLVPTHPACSDSWSITDLSRKGQLNGLGFAGANCATAGTPTYVIFDANRPGGTVSTYGSANGVNCGWVSSPDHQEIDGPSTRSDDYYFHCSW